MYERLYATVLYLHKLPSWHRLYQSVQCTNAVEAGKALKSSAKIDKVTRYVLTTTVTRCENLKQVLR